MFHVPHRDPQEDFDSDPDDEKTETRGRKKYTKLQNGAIGYKAYMISRRNLGRPQLIDFFTRRIARYIMDLIKGGVHFEVYNVEQCKHGDAGVEDVSKVPDTDKEEDETEEQRDSSPDPLQG